MVALVDDVQQSVSGGLQLHLSEVNRLAGEQNVHPVGRSCASQLELVAASYLEEILCVSLHAYDRWRICNCDLVGAAWVDDSVRAAQLEGTVFSVVVDRVHLEVSLDKAAVLQSNYLLGSFAHGERLEVKFLGAYADEGELSDPTDLDDFLVRVGAFLELKDSGRDDDLGLEGRK